MVYGKGSENLVTLQQTFLNIIFFIFMFVKIITGTDF